ncbi:hypothetical protein [Reyranella soli]|jgi:hypothetical protein|uniref:Uncharacterized protein n=1 Tax=Reyranella soli TaxID=1230389 RepID=A0A512NHI4_9HYPH|nr:hypothetical protein [Reyranella soli]GEP58372.1 hypothetical protein RSO01_55380 [Reyranella soli]
MRSVVVVLLGLIAGVHAAQAQAWLTVADAEGRFWLEMPVPFDLPPSQVAPDGTVTFAYVHETPELALRFEVVDHGEAMQVLPMPVSRMWDSERMVQVRSHVVGRRTYRVVAIFPPELEGDATILRFMRSVHYNDDAN